MNYFKKIILFALPYKRFAFLNIVFNILYAFFSALSFVALIPMLNVLFDKTPKVDVEPVYTGIFDLQNYIENTINYKVGSALGENPLGALTIASAGRGS